MTFDQKLDKILLQHGAEQGELHYSLKQAIKQLIIEDVIGENETTNYLGHPNIESNRDFNRNDLRREQRAILGDK